MVSLRGVVLWFMYAVWALLVFSVGYDFGMGVYWRVAIWLIFLFISMGFYYNARHLSLWSHVSIALLTLLNIFGEIYLEWYYVVPYYDKFLHAFVPFCMFFLAYDFLGPYIRKHRSLLFYSLLLVLSLSVAWEFLEIGFDYYFDAPLIGVFISEPVSGVSSYQLRMLQNPYVDTFFDVLADIVGSLVAYLVGLKYLLKKERLTKKNIP